MRYATLPLWFIIGLLTGLHAQVVTEYGPVSGLRQGSGYVFLGIPFASPPVGQLRWRPTKPPESWSSPLPTMDFPPSCPQKHYTQGDTSYTLEGDEDCLYLNVWSPGLTGTYPVMVFIHGGGNQQGSSGETVGGITLYDGQQLSNRGKVVVVTIQYRLGILGYLVHPGLEAENAQGTSGNYGVMDQIFALQWVQDNIASFGGDPNNVTLFGESAGGVNVGNLMTCPAAKGLFHKAIIESAVPVLNAYTLAESEGIDLVNGFISSGSDVEKIAYMRSLPADDLSRTLSNPVQGGIVQQTWQPVVDHQLFTDFPNQVYQSGSYHQVPLIIGSNADEMRPGVPPIVTPGQVRALVNIAVPVGYEPDADLLEQAAGRVVLLRDPLVAVRGADLIATDVWSSMGKEEEQQRRLQDFKGYQVNAEVMAQAKPEAIFLHCLPAHRGEEVSAEVIDGPQSQVWEEAENRLHTQKALMEFLLSDAPVSA